MIGWQQSGPLTHYSGVRSRLKLPVDRHPTQIFSPPSTVQEKIRKRTKRRQDAQEGT
jgi:hypothetical protein